MQLPDYLKSKTLTELEEWFLAAISAPELPLSDLFAVLRSLGDSGRANIAEWAGMLQDAIAVRGDREGMIELLLLRCEGQGRDSDLAPVCAAAARQVFTDKIGQAFVKGVGFENGVPPAEALRRLRTLNRLKPGIFCHDKTWGFGVVKRLDEYYQKVTIDFTGKPGHQMTFGYAGETLELLDDSHLGVRFHRDPDGFRQLLKSDPAEVVRIVLRSYGELSVPLLKEKLVGEILKEAEWKEFWDAARKALKSDPLVEIPSRRNDPVRLLARAKAYDADWFAALGKERDMGRLLDLMKELQNGVDTASIAPGGAAVLRERLAFVLRGAEGVSSDLKAVAVMTAARFGFTGDDVAGLAASEASLWRPHLFLDATLSMRARDAESLVRYLWTRDEEKTLALYLSTLAGMKKLSVLSHVLAFLIDAGKSDACAGALRAAFEARTCGVAVVYWLADHPDLAQRWAVLTATDLLGLVLDSLELTLNGEELRTQNQLREKVERKEWLAVALGGLDQVQRAAFLTRVANCRGWDSTGRRSVLARLITLFPDLQKAIVAEDPAEKTATRFTSWRSYRERQAQLRELVEVAIPANSRAIAHARGYGDLRENFEYQTAKDEQRLLMRRQQEMERDLREVRGTDFAGMPTGGAGTGTIVTLARPDGREETYAILGEWDRNEALGIISSQSLIAQRLAGHAAGDEVLLPSATADEPCRIVRVAALSDAVKAWIGGVEPSP